MRLSRNFSLSEFTRSDTAKRLGLLNDPSRDDLTNIKVTALGLEQVRRVLDGRSIRITSGYRNRAVNAAVGGVSNSAHAKGFAADITVRGLTAFEVAKEISLSDIAFDQLIYEKGRNIVHISFDPRLRGEVLSQHHGPSGGTMQGIVP